MTGNGYIDVEWMGERLLLTGQRALVWPAQQTLLVADVHLGKEAVFRRNGLAIPDGPTDRSLSRLAQVLRTHDCRRVVILGDFMHAPPGEDDTWPATVSRWLDAHPDVDVEVVAGNHDRALGRERLDARIHWHVDALTLGPFELAHEPVERPTAFGIYGHVHPVVRARVGPERLRAPVYWYRRTSAVLPAFGQFTGGHAIRPQSGERIWLVDDGAVVELPIRGRYTK